MAGTIGTSLYLLVAMAIVINLLHSVNASRIKLTRIHLVLAVVVIALKGIENGEDGIISSALAAAMALALTSLIYRTIEKIEEDAYIAMPIAALIGPISTVAVFSISIFFFLMQKILGSESELAPQYFFSADEETATALGIDERSALAEIEARKLLRTNGYSAAKFSDSSAGNIAEEHLSRVMPWSFKLIIAAMIVLLYGARI